METEVLLPQPQQPQPQQQQQQQQQQQYPQQQAQQMEIASSTLSASTAPTTLNILCCLCGAPFNPSQSRTNICLKCLTNSSDITMGITKQGILNFCRMCHRALKPPWVFCERESREMMSLCLKKIKGLNRVKLIDSVFIWTEPHSRRIKLRLTIQKEVQNNTWLQQSFVVEFFEHFTQCEDCKKEYTPNTWGALVQVRQKVEHKKTFFYLEQLILKHNAHDKVLNVKEEEDGLDFFYKNRTHAMRLVDFLQNVVPMTVKMSKQLVSHDMNSNVFNYKYTWCLDVPRVCREDLVVLPPKLCRELGGVCPILLCYKLTNQIHLLDPYSMKRIDISAERFFHYENDLQLFSPKNQTTEFLVQDSQKLGMANNLNESQMSSMSNVFLERVVEVTVSRMTDWVNFNVKTQLGDILKPGTVVLGYDLTTLNFSTDYVQMKNVPEIVLLKRQVDRNQRKRIWKLKRMEQEGIMVDENPTNKKKNKKIEKEQNDFEEFLEDVELNPDMRTNINLYKDQEAIKKLNPKEIERYSKPSGKRNNRKRKFLKVLNNENNKNQHTTTKKEGDNQQQQPEDQDGQKEQDQQQQQQLDKQPGAKKSEKSEKDKQDKQEEEKKDSNKQNKKNAYKPPQSKKTHNFKESTKAFEKNVDNDEDDNDDDEEEEDACEIKLFELLEDLNLDDKDDNELLEADADNDKVIDEFIKSIEKVKIEK